MGHYRKKPVVIEAARWFSHGDDPDVVPYPHVVLDPKQCEECPEPPESHGWIRTLEDGHRVCPGDWLITGVAGERYPCKPDIFTASYEEVS